MDWPRITIIIPSYNQASFLEEAMCSVLDQRYPALEMMVFDGGSRDGSKHIIEKYSRYLTAWYCEPDDGQSAAIDFGMSLASGVLAGWLNSDDILLPESLVSVAEAYGSSPEGGIFGGNLVFVDTGEKLPVSFACQRIPRDSRDWGSLRSAVREASFGREITLRPAGYAATFIT